MREEKFLVEEERHNAHVEIGRTCRMLRCKYSDDTQIDVAVKFGNMIQQNVSHFETGRFINWHLILFYLNEYCPVEELPVIIDRFATLTKGFRTIKSKTVKKEVL